MALIISSLVPYLAAQIVFKRQWGVVSYLPRFQLTHHATSETFCQSGGGTLRNIGLRLFYY
ncbi:hypothetical protein [Hafnia paralvei]|uniref:hypothetical protein n=1 Tax=Hafnia paralvei TaxID=546367 RepID=UPI000F4E52BA|nr:hypothetical protein [Hafnia paralvei]TBL52983.1 hypothetical protein EYZ00_13110 [Hafnia paralvei]